MRRPQSLALLLTVFSISLVSCSSGGSKNITDSAIAARQSATRIESNAIEGRQHLDAARSEYVLGNDPVPAIDRADQNLEVIQNEAKSVGEKAETVLREVPKVKDIESEWAPAIKWAGIGGAIIGVLAIGMRMKIFATIGGLLGGLLKRKT